MIDTMLMIEVHRQSAREVLFLANINLPSAKYLASLSGYMNSLLSVSMVCECNGDRIMLLLSLTNCPVPLFLTNLLTSLFSICLVSVLLHAFYVESSCIIACYFIFRLSVDARIDGAVKHALAVRQAVTFENYVLFFRLYKKAPNLNTFLMGWPLPIVNI